MDRFAVTVDWYTRDAGHVARMLAAGGGEKTGGGGGATRLLAVSTANWIAHGTSSW